MRALRSLFQALVFTLCLLPSVVFGQPKLSVVGGLKFDLGQVYISKVIARDLTLKNVGTDTLTISNVSATCGCTGTLMSTDRLAPGESGTLSITFNPKNIKGAVEKAVSMDTNDSTQSHVRITFTAKVVPVIELDRDYLVYRTTMDSIVSDSFTITNSSTATIHILSVTPKVDGVTAALSSDKLKAGESATVTCKFSPKKSGTTKGNISITTDHPNAPSLDVRFYGWVGSKKSNNASTNQN